MCSLEADTLAAESGQVMKAPVRGRGETGRRNGLKRLIECSRGKPGM
jgi:hypothetical protein